LVLFLSYLCDHGKISGALSFWKRVVVFLL
jgi:hypothetical protein